MIENYTVELNRSALTLSTLKFVYSDEEPKMPIPRSLFNIESEPYVKEYEVCIDIILFDSNGIIKVAVWDLSTEQWNIDETLD